MTFAERMPSAAVASACALFVYALVGGPFRAQPALAAPVASPKPAAAHKAAPPDGALVSQTIAAFVTAANKGDAPGMSAAFADAPTIVLNVPPYRWNGAGAVKQFASDLAHARTGQGATDVFLTLNPNKAMFLGGSHAYVTVPATYAYKQNGHPVTEDGVLVFALDKIAGAWKITSLTWGMVR
jgi:ketosteroid isomerase-like protein